MAHAHEQYRTDLMSKAVVHADAIAGLLVAAALVRPERSAGMKVLGEEEADGEGVRPRRQP
jgi:predicted hydrolase (HD superfamily)